MTTISKRTQIGEATSAGTFLGVGNPGQISGLFSRPVFFEITVMVCGRTLDEKIPSKQRKYAELLGEDSENYFIGYLQ